MTSQSLPINKIQHTFRKYNLPELGISKLATKSLETKSLDAKSLETKNQYHFYKPLHNNDFQYLNRFKHLVTYNVEAPRYFLYLTTCLSEEPHQQATCQAFYLENKNEAKTNQTDLVKLVTLGSHRLSPELYQETILDGQIINQTFLISDLLVYKGQNMLGSAQNSNTGHSMSYRLSLLDSFLKNHWQPDQLIDTYKLELKPYVELNKINDMWQNRAGLPYEAKINGLVFRPNVRSMKNFTVYLTQPHCHELETESEIGRFIVANSLKSSANGRRNASVEKDLCFTGFAPAPSWGWEKDLCFAGFAPAGKDDHSDSNGQIEANSPSIKSKHSDHHEALTHRQFLVVNDNNINKPDVYYLYSLENPSEKRAVAVITNLENSLRLQKIFQEFDPQFKGLKFKCVFHSRFRRWEPFEMVRAT